MTRAFGPAKLSPRFQASLWLGVAAGLPLILTGSAHAMPDWAKVDGQRLVGSHYRVVCSGRGPDLDLARVDALRACTGFAARQLPTSIQLKSLTIESERDVGFHQEVSENLKLNGLVCKPDREEAEEKNGAITVWLACEYDLAKVALSGSDPNGASPIPKTGGLIQSPRRSLSMATVPPCDSILVRGDRARVIACGEDPISLVLEPSDRQIIIRARDYQPRVLDIASLRENKTDVVQVLLDRL